MALEYRICTRCIMDTDNDLDIVFDDAGHCNHCRAAIVSFSRMLPPPEERAAAFERTIDMIRRDGRGKEYDCVVGISGGVDSTYVMYLVKEAGLRPLAIHFDNGWNSELAVDNIKTALDTLGVELFTYVVDWEEFRDLQLAFLKSSVKNTEVPTDHGIVACTYRTAAKMGLKYIVCGNNQATEAILPDSYGYFHEDLRHIKSIHSRFGTRKLSTFPMLGLSRLFYYTYVRGIRKVRLLNTVDYNKVEVKELLSKKLGWRDYGGKHYESIWTRFHQGHYLVAKYGLDKRRAHLSTLVASGQMSRDEALAEIETPPYNDELLQQDIEYVIKKFNLTRDEFDRIMQAPPADARDFPNNYVLFRLLLGWRQRARSLLNRS